MTAIPGSWLKNVQPIEDVIDTRVLTDPESRSLKKLSSSPESGATTSPTRHSKQISPSSIHSNDSSKKLNKSPICTCGHRRGDHRPLAETPEDAQLDRFYSECGGKDCECSKFKKKPYERTEHLTNRPLAQSSDLHILKSKLLAEESNSQPVRRNNKKGKKR